MIVIKNYPHLWYKDNFRDQRFMFGDFTIEFTEDEYRYFTDLLVESKEKPEEILQALIEEGLYSFMQGD